MHPALLDQTHLLTCDFPSGDVFALCSVVLGSRGGCSSEFPPSAVVEEEGKRSEKRGVTFFRSNASKSLGLKPFFLIWGILRKLDYFRFIPEDWTISEMDLGLFHVGLRGDFYTHCCFQSLLFLPYWSAAGLAVDWGVTYHSASFPSFCKVHCLLGAVRSLDKRDLWSSAVELRKRRSSENNWVWTRGTWRGLGSGLDSSRVVVGRGTAALHCLPGAWCDTLTDWPTAGAAESCPSHGGSLLLWAILICVTVSVSHPRPTAVDKDSKAHYCEDCRKQAWESSCAGVRGQGETMVP